MNIVVFGAGAIGSLFGAYLARKNHVVLIGRKTHVNAIRKYGLNVTNKTSFHISIQAEESVKTVAFSPDLLILTVKSYDTLKAIEQAKSIISRNTLVLSLQNGLDNIQKIHQIVDPSQVIAGVTTQGSIYTKPGTIRHTGTGMTIVGEVKKTKSSRITDITSLFNSVGIKTNPSDDIIKEIWSKAIVNSSINPLTGIFRCKNGYLLENPLLTYLLERLCKESTTVANRHGIHLSINHMIEKTKEVVRVTTENISSMLQSIQKMKETEIDSINGMIISYGNTYGVDTTLNQIVTHIIRLNSKYK